MSSERIDIVVQEQGSRVVKRRIESIGTTAHTAHSSVQLLQKALLTLGVGAIFSTAVRTMASFEQALSTVRAVSGATADEFDRMRAKAEELGAATRYTATQAAEGMVHLARAGMNANEQLDTISQTLTLAQAGGLDLANAAEITVKVLRGFRLETDQASRATDVLALTANSATTDVYQLADALKYVGPVAAGVGLSLEETTAAMAALSDAGLQGSLAGTGLRRTLSELETPSGKTKKILRDMGLTTDEVRISQAGLTQALIRLKEAGVDTGLALEIFGDRGGPAFEVLASSIPKVQKMTAELRNAEGTAKRVADVMDDNLLGSLLRARSAFEAVLLAVGRTGGVDLLRGALERLAGVLRFLADRIEIVYGALVGVALYAIPKVSLALVGLIKLAIASGAALTVALGALVAYRHEIQMTTDSTVSLGDFGAAAFERIKLGGQVALTALRDRLGDLGGGLDGIKFDLEGMVRFSARALDGWIGLWRGAINALLALWQGIGPAMLDLGIEAMNGLTRVYSRGIQGILALLRTIGGVISGVAGAWVMNLQMMAQAGQQAIRGEWEAAKTTAANAQVVFKTQMEEAFRDLPGKISKNFNDAVKRDFIPQIENTAKGAAGRLGEAITQGFADGMSQITVFEDAVNSMFDRAEEISKDRIERLKETMSDAPGAGSGQPPGDAPTPDPTRTLSQFEIGVGNAMQKISDTVNYYGTQVEATLVNAFSSAEDALVNLVTTGKLSLKDMVKGMMADLARLASRMMMMNLLGQQGLNILPAPLGGRAHGGDVTAGVPYWVGERGRREVFVPDQDGRVVPGEKLGEQEPPSVTIIQVSSMEEAYAAMRSAKGRRIIMQAGKERAI